MSEENDIILEALQNKNDWQHLQDCPNGAIYHYEGLRIFFISSTKQLMIFED